MSLGIRAKLVLLGLAIVIVVSFGFTLLQLRLSQGWIEEDLRERAIAFAREIAVTIGDRREFESGALLDGQIRQIMAVRPNVLQVDILAFGPADNRVVATSHHQVRLPFHRKDGEEVARGRTISRLVPGRAWEIMTPVRLEGQVVGAVAARFSLQRADQLAARGQAWALGLTAASVAVMGVLMSLAAALVVERPVRRLMAAIEAVRGGDSSATAPVTSGDEIGRLAAHFNEMMVRLNRFSDELQARVDEATAELERRYSEVERLNLLLLRMQRTASHAERLAVSGRIMAEVAHEVGTPLHSIAGHLELLRADLGERDPSGVLGRRLRIIDSEVARVTQIISQLLDLTRRPPLEVASVDIRQVVRDTTDLIRPGLAAAEIDLVLDMTPVPALRVRAPSIQQALLNLLTNAIDATPAGGRVSVRTRAEDGTVVIEVADTGTGLPAVLHKEIFEPFFSTKEPGRGTGLGLFIASQIVRDHGGRIDVESEVGAGATFRIVLPGTGPR